MIRKDCFAHQCAGERDLVGRVEAAGYLPCKCSWSVGENIAWGSGSSSSPRRIVDAWMNSAPHRANILDRRFEDIGVAVDDGSPGGGRAVRDVHDRLRLQGLTPLPQQSTPSWSDSAPHRGVEFVLGRVVPSI